MEGTVYIDETFYKVRAGDIAHKDDGTQFRGLSRKQICIGIGTDGKRTIAFTEGFGKVSGKRTLSTFRDLKKIYGSANEEEALDELEAFGEIWDSKYPMIRKSWENHWNDLKEFLSYPEEIRKLIYTTNAIESLNYTLRKVTKNRNAFPDDDSVYKIMYLAINNISKKWTMPVQNWGVIINQLSIIFGDRVKL